MKQTWSAICEDVSFIFYLMDHFAVTPIFTHLNNNNNNNNNNNIGQNVFEDDFFKFN